MGVESAPVEGLPQVQPKQSLYSSEKSTIVRNNKSKKDIITTVGSVHALNILLKDDRKYLKKVVTIDAKFL